MERHFWQGCHLKLSKTTFHGWSEHKLSYSSCKVHNVLQTTEIFLSLAHHEIASLRKIRTNRHVIFFYDLFFFVRWRPCCLTQLRMGKLLQMWKNVPKSTEFLQVRNVQKFIEFCKVGEGWNPQVFYFFLSPLFSLCERFWTFFKTSKI